MDEQVQAVQAMQDFIEAHLTDRITPGDLAKAANYSPWYAHRLFVKLVGIPPADYIRKLRLMKSALKLRDEAVRITDIAFESGFASVDGYQRAFSREFGINPHAYAKDPVPIGLYTPYGVKFRRDERGSTMENVKSVFVQVIEKPSRKAIIKRGVKAQDYFAYCDEVGCDVWGLLRSMKSLSGEPVCLWLPTKYVTPGTSVYVQGVEVEGDYRGVVPEGFDVIDLPAAKYLMFQGEPFAEEDYASAIVSVQAAIEKYDPAFIGLSWDHENPRVQLEPIGSRGYIELHPVK